MCLNIFSAARFPIARAIGVGGDTGEPGGGKEYDDLAAVLLRVLDDHASRPDAGPEITVE
jgi:hypothetical protein